MASPHRRWSALVLLLACFPLSISCKRVQGALTPHTQQGAAPGRTIDEPPALHTGGLGVLGATPEGRQGPGTSPGSAGNPVAAGIATGIGMAVVGGTVVKTAAACAQPNAPLTCLRGPGPADDASDGGAP